MQTNERPDDTSQPEVPYSTKEPSRMDEFVNTSSAAKLSGTFHQSLGFVKRKLGGLAGDESLELSGEIDELVGKAHGLVGAIREVRELVVKKLTEKRTEGKRMLRSHAGKLLDTATDMVRDLKAFIK